MKEGWKYVTLRDVISVQNGYAFDSKLFNGIGEGVPLIRIRDLKKFSSTYTTEECSPEYKVFNGDLLVGMDGDFNVCLWQNGNAFLNQRVCKIIPSNRINLKYLYYFLPFPLKKINDNTAFATVKHLSSKQILTIQLPIPPLPEQERIVSLLDAEFAKIDAIKANAEKQLQDAKALFQSALKDYLTPKEGWEEKYLHEISSYYNGLTYKPTDVSNTGMLVLRSSNIQNNCLSLEDKVKVSIDVNEKLKVHKGDIIMCSRNGSKALIGKVALIPYEYSNLTFGTFMMIIKSALNPFLYFYFLSENFKKQIWKGEANMINQITRYMLDEVLVQYPKNEDEQRRIVKKLHELSAKIQSLQQNYEQTITLCSDLKQSILKDIFG